MSLRQWFALGNGVIHVHRCQYAFEVLVFRWLDNPHGARALSHQFLIAAAEQHPQRAGAALRHFHDEIVLLREDCADRCCRQLTDPDIDSDIQVRKVGANAVPQFFELVQARFNLNLVKFLNGRLRRGTRSALVFQVQSVKESQPGLVDGGQARCPAHQAMFIRPMICNEKNVLKSSHVLLNS